MPARRPRPRLAALLAASMVSLFVVMVSAPSHAVGVRAGHVVSGPSSQHAGPVDDHAAADDAVVLLDLSGLAPVPFPSPEGATQGSPGGASDGVRLVDTGHLTDRGPPAR